MIRRTTLFLLLLLFAAGCSSSPKVPTQASSVGKPAATSAPLLPQTGGSGANAATPAAGTDLSATAAPAKGSPTAAVTQASPTVAPAKASPTAAPTKASAAAAPTQPSGSTSGTPVASTSGAQTYTVLVGGEDVQNGADLEAFFPAALHIHAGDTVTWQANTHEIHTVTFLPNGEKTPDFMVPVPKGQPGEMMFNPQVAFPSAPQDHHFDGSVFANSGILGMAEGQARDFTLTFTKPGTYTYLCVVHNEEKMTGAIVVEPASAQVSTPAAAQAQGKQELDALMAKVPDVQKAAQAATQPDDKNADGTTTHHILVGFSQGQIDLQSFFPNKLDVHPGDTVEWTLPKEDMAPHTVTFLNGAQVPEAIQAKPQAGGPPMLTFSQEAAQPQNIGKPLTNQGIFNSGVIDPHAPGTHTYSLKLGSVTGELPYVCLLHDEMGMKGVLVVSLPASK